MVSDTQAQVVQSTSGNVAPRHSAISGDWFTVSITLWPIIACIALLLFRQQIGELLRDLRGFSFGSFSLKLRRRIMKTATTGQFDQIKCLSAYDMKFFFVVASQSWKIKSVTWNLSVQESLELHEKLERAGLVTIVNKDRAVDDKKVNALLTPLGEEFYRELTSLIAGSIK